MTTVGVGLGLAAGVGVVGPAGALEATGSAAVRASTVQASAVMAAPMTQEQIEAYIGLVYSDLFGREPDPAGLATWSTALRSGVPLRAVADSITGSAEFRTGLIHDAYASFLGREPDAEGVRHWLDRMGRGLTIQQLAAGFLGSMEYYLLANPSAAPGVVNNEELDRFLGNLYEDVLGRTPAQTELDHWSHYMWPHYTGGAWSPEKMALNFLMSTERLSGDIDAEYQWLLGRNLDPAGQSTWVSAIQSGTRFEAVIGSIISSPEYLSYL